MSEEKFYTEYTFILPEYTPDGVLMRDTHSALEDDLLQNFTGFYTQPVETFLMDEELIHDPAIKYTVLIKGLGQRKSFLKLINKYGNLLKQSKVYLKDFDGKVFFLGVKRQ